MVSASSSLHFEGAGAGCGPQLLCGPKQGRVLVSARSALPVVGMWGLAGLVDDGLRADDKSGRGVAASFRDK